MSSTKPAFKLSVSLINKYLYYKANPYDSNLESLKRALSGVWDSNEWTERGEEFEKRVFDGQEGKFSELVSGLKFQQWKKKFLDLGNFVVVFNGKIDALDDNKKVIYDIKRVDSFKETSYDDKFTCQHLIYQWMFDEQYHFFYVIAYGKSSVEGDIVVYKEPIPVEEAELKISSLVKEFLTFLSKKNLLELYQEKFRLE